MICADEIDRAFAALSGAHERCFEAGESLAEARLIYASAEARAILNGLSGKNETERKAQLFEQLRSQRSVLDAAEQDLRSARYHFDLAQAEVERLRFHLRLLSEVGPRPSPVRSG